MINYTILNRTRNVVTKCGLGSIIQPANSSIQQKYAKQHNLLFQNGQFWNTDSNGAPTGGPVNVSENDLKGFQQELNASRTAVLGQISQGIDTASALLFSNNPRITNQAPETQAISGAYDMAANVVGQVDPLAGTVMKIGGFASDALHAAGIGTDGATGFDKFADSKVGMLTGVGIINGIGAEKSQDFSIDRDTLEKVGGSYGGAVSGLQEAVDKSGKKYGLFSSGARHAANRYINKMRAQQNAMAKIANTVTDQRELVDMMGDVAAQAYSSQIAGGFDARYFRAKEGGKFTTEAFEPEFIDIRIERITPHAFSEGGVFDEIINPTTGQIEEWSPEIVDVDKLKTGGKLGEQLDAPETEPTTQQNLIPEGALHKNKHNMDNAEELTKKGIPVVDDKHVQQAEIEREEIIFTKEVTAKLEELYKIYYSDNSTQKEKGEAAISAGKLLTKEIMLNTDDRTGLIDTLQQGGTVTPVKPEYKDWIISVPADWISDKYDLETAYKVLPFDKLERWRKEVLKPADKQSKETDWHLPSVHQVDSVTIMFLKKGKSTKDNPELKGEFDFYTSNPDFSKEWKMQFNKDENRWYYKQRDKAKPES